MQLPRCCAVCAMLDVEFDCPKAYRKVTVNAKHSDTHAEYLRTH